MEMKMKRKSRSHRYDINRPRSRHEHKYSKYKKCRSMMMLICIKQHLSNTWSPVHEKVKQHWGWVEKSIAYKKTARVRCKFNTITLLQNFITNKTFLLILHLLQTSKT